MRQHLQLWSLPLMSQKNSTPPACKVTFQEAPRFFFFFKQVIICLHAMPRSYQASNCHFTGAETSPEWFLELVEDTEWLMGPVLVRVLAVLVQGLGSALPAWRLLPVPVHCNDGCWVLTPSSPKIQGFALHLNSSFQLGAYIMFLPLPLSSDIWNRINKWCCSGGHEWWIRKYSFQVRIGVRLH